jgi:hypothetical protein
MKFWKFENISKKFKEIIKNIFWFFYFVNIINKNLYYNLLKNVSK